MDKNRRLYNFFAEENKRLKAYVQRRIQSLSEMDAEDIVGEVMLNMLGRDSVGDAENLTAYIYRSLRNRMIDHYRKTRHTVSLESFLDEDSDISFISLLSDGTSVSGEVERKELMRMISQAISMLERRQRAIFVATELNGKTFRELSKEWNEPIGTLLSRKSRAVKALREMLKSIKEQEIER